MSAKEVINRLKVSYGREDWAQIVYDYEDEITKALTTLAKIEAGTHVLVERDDSMDVHAKRCWIVHPDGELYSPDYFSVVPKEPTDFMTEGLVTPKDQAIAVYKAMIAAAEVTE